MDIPPQVHAIQMTWKLNWGRGWHSCACFPMHSVKMFVESDLKNWEVILITFEELKLFDVIEKAANKHKGFSCTIVAHCCAQEKKIFILMKMLVILYSLTRTEIPKVP